MKKFLVTAYDTMGNHSVLQLVKSKNKETVMSYMYNKYIKDKNYWEISSDNFRSYYEHIGTRLDTLPYSYAYTKRENNIEVYDGTTTFFYKFFEIKNEIDNYAVILETDILKPNLVSRTVYYKVLDEIDNLRILYNEIEGTNIQYCNEFDWLSSYESAFFSDELLDYNDFDFDTGEIKDVNIIGGTTNNESSLVICKINFEDIILL